MVRGIAGLRTLLLLALLPLLAHAGDECWIRGQFTGNSPRPTRLPEKEAWQQAAACAARAGDAFVLVGSGRSMQPLYPPGTILVLQQVPYDSLRSGQTVLYRNRSARAVAHLLVAKARDGWRVRGLNNRTHDGEPVVEDNLVGVVVAAFTPEAPAGSQISTAPKRGQTDSALFASSNTR